MVSRLIMRLLHGLTSNDKLVDKLAETKVIRRAAQLTAYAITKGQKSIKEFQDAGGMEKMKQVTQQDVRTVSKELKEYLTYDLPKTFKKSIRDFIERNYRR